MINDNKYIYSVIYLLQFDIKPFLDCSKNIFNKIIYFQNKKNIIDFYSQVTSFYLLIK